jgi:putative ABC transport system permease protein
VGEQSRKFFSVASLILAILGVVALFVSSLGMFNTMIITLLERTEEIGIMKAIGATDRNILSIFIFESALMGFLGGVSGIFMGFVVQYIFNFVVNFIAVRMGGEAFDLFHSPLWFIALLITSSLLIGIFTGLIPARKASIVDPLDALKRR